MQGWVWRRLKRFWELDLGLSVILGLLILVVFVLPPFAGRAGERTPLIDIAFSLLLIAGVAGIQGSPTVRGLLLALAALATVIRWLPWATATPTTLSSLVCLGLMAILVLIQAFRAGPVTVHRIQGAVAAYLFLGLAWAYAYELVAALAPGAFAAAQPGALPGRGLMYFSFVTLTTVGYGDITPVHPAARTLALLEALTGQLYPAILLARLVSLQASGGGER
jgi:hypothetical protein